MVKSKVMRWMGAGGGVLLAAGLMLGSGALVKSAEAGPQVSARQGATAPDFALKDFQGKKQSVSQFKGKPVVVNFWASWCGPCREEMPELARAADHWQGKAAFLGVNLTERDSVPVAASFLEKYKVAYPNVQDDKGQAADLYDIFVIPTTVVIDKNGQVAARIQGPVSEKQLNQLLQKLL